MRVRLRLEPIVLCCLGLAAVFRQGFGVVRCVSRSRATEPWLIMLLVAFSIHFHGCKQTGFVTTGNYLYTAVQPAHRKISSGWSVGQLPRVQTKLVWRPLDSHAPFDAVHVCKLQLCGAKRYLAVRCSCQIVGFWQHRATWTVQWSCLLGYC